MGWQIAEPGPRASQTSRQWFDSHVSNHWRYFQMDQLVETFEWLASSIRSMARDSNVSVDPPGCRKTMAVKL